MFVPSFPGVLTIRIICRCLSNINLPVPSPRNCDSVNLEKGQESVKTQHPDDSEGQASMSNFHLLSELCNESSSFLRRALASGSLSHKTRTETPFWRPGCSPRRGLRYAAGCPGRLQRTRPCSEPCEFKEQSAPVQAGGGAPSGADETDVRTPTRRPKDRRQNKRAARVRSGHQGYKIKRTAS